MKSTAKISFLLLSSKFKRTISFVCLIALLSVTAGLLGNNILNKKDTLDPVTIAVVDLEQSSYSKLMFTTLVSSVDGKGLLDIRKTSEKEAEQMLANGELTAVFIIPEDFFDSVLSGENKAIIASYNPYTPLQSSLTQMYVEQILEILKASQVGIYTTMDYTRENVPDQYDKMHTAINLRYINAALAHNKIVEPTEVSLTGSIDSFTFYLFSTLIFLLMLGCCLYTFIIEENFSVHVLNKLKRQKKSSLGVAGGWILGWWGWYAILGVLIVSVYALAASKMGMVFSPMLYVSFLLILLCFSAIGVFLGFMFKNSAYSTAVLCVYSLLSLLLSGGVIPINYLPNSFETISKLFPNYWAMRSVQFGLSGVFSLSSALVLIGFAVFFWLLTSVYIAFNKREAVG